MKNAFIAIGSNLPSRAGTPEVTLLAALHALSELGPIISRSSLYRTAPVGFENQPAFLNAVINLEFPPQITPHFLLRALLRIERNFGRDRSQEQPMGPRTLDLDLLLFGDLVLSTADLTLPHPRLHERAFVLVPLAEIAPDLRHPLKGATMKQLLKKLKLQSGQVECIESGTWYR